MPSFAEVLHSSHNHSSTGNVQEYVLVPLLQRQIYSLHRSTLLTDAVQGQWSFTWCKRNGVCN